MKKFNKKVMSLASVAAILASFATMPAFAAESSVYSVSYETLTTAITIDDGNTIPAGAVAVTMTINDNQSFDATTVKLAIENDYEVMVDTSGSPIVQKGEVLESSMIAGAVSSDDNSICIVGATDTTCTAMGDLFTIYFSATNMDDSNFVTVTSCDFEEYSPQITVDAMLPPLPSGNVCAPCQVRVENGMTIEYYIVGDTTDDGIINVFDAVNIMTAHSRYAEIQNVPERTDAFDALEIPISYVRANLNMLFDEVVYAESPDADQDHSIGLDDADEVLRYSAIAGVAGDYDGRVGIEIIVRIHPGFNNN